MNSRAQNTITILEVKDYGFSVKCRYVLLIYILQQICLCLSTHFEVLENKFLSNV